MIRELNNEEVSNVSGAGFWYDLGRAVGTAMGAGAATQQHIDKLADPMLGAMQYGA
jgi:hypothetical protein